MTDCTCGSDSPYSDCCGPYLDGTEKPPTAEALMRARYSAFAKGEVQFIVDTIDPAHRDGVSADGFRKWAERSEWLGLEICRTKDGGPDDTEGIVEFKALYREKDKRQVHHEIAEFRKSDDQWFFVDGNPPNVVTQVRSSPKIGRNEPCHCGSGVKFKKCCGR